MEERQTFFTQLNRFFDHVYVITLHRATDRHQHLKKELEGLDYELFFGRDKQNFSVDELKQTGIYNESLAKLNHRYGKPMWDGQIGCAWSHADVYRDIIAKGYGTALILEDDVVIDTATVSNFSPVLKQLPADWELLYLGFGENEKPTFATPIKKIFYHLLRRTGNFNLSHTAINNLYPAKLSEHVYKAGYHDSTHAYAITQPAAKSLLALQQPICFIADNLLAYAVSNEIVKGHLVLPKMIHQQYQLGIDSVSYLNH